MAFLGYSCYFKVCSIQTWLVPIKPHKQYPVRRDTGVHFQSLRDTIAACDAAKLPLRSLDWKEPCQFPGRSVAKVIWRCNARSLFINMLPVKSYFITLLFGPILLPEILSHFPVINGDVRRILSGYWVLRHSVKYYLKVFMEYFPAQLQKNCICFSTSACLLAVFSELIWKSSWWLVQRGCTHRFAPRKMFTVFSVKLL